MIFSYGATSFFCSLYGEQKRSKYFIAIKKNEGNVLNTLEIYTPLLPPRGKFYADPFLFKYEGVNYLFFEDYDYKKGVISYVTLDQNGVISSPRMALELPFHLSFPYVFQDGKTIYMIPETYGNKSISLYKCLVFPHVWKKERILVRGDYFSDPILFKYNDLYWLFASIHSDRLCIYYSEDLESRFIPHPINQKRLRGRNAGPLFYINDRPIRPNMDCSQKYGRAVILKELILLNKDEFMEKEIACIEPNWAPGLVGTHSFCINEDYLVYDGERMISPDEDSLYSSP